MEELIKVQHDNDRITVLARDLHGFLEIESNFTTWFRRMCEYGFEEAKDFVPFLEESTGGRTATDYQITIEMAKEIAMIQRNEKANRQDSISFNWKMIGTARRKLWQGLYRCHKENYRY